MTMTKKKSNKIQTSLGEKVFTVFNYIFFTVLCLIMVYPFWHVAMESLSSTSAALRGGVFLYPKGFTLGPTSPCSKTPTSSPALGPLFL